MRTLKIKKFVTKLMALILAMALALSLSACDDTLSAPAGADAGYYMGVIATTDDYKTFHNTFVAAGVAKAKGEISYDEYLAIADVFDSREMDIESARMRQIRAELEG